MWALATMPSHAKANPGSPLSCLHACLRFSMFDFVRKHTRLFQFILLILILPSFALVGMQGYTSFMDGANASVASVDGRKITQTEWDAAHRDQVERMRRQMPNLDAK